MAGTIGIKIANGDFYPIITEGRSTVKKRLVLTTVHDGQENVQIDLFRSTSSSMQDAQYIGSLVVEDIMPRPRGEASIEMIISCSADGMITADARDLDAGDDEHNTLSVSLKTLESHQRSQDFDLDNKASAAASRYEQTDTEEKRKTPWFILIFVVIFMIIVLALLWLFLFGGRDTQIIKDVERSLWGDNSGTTQTSPPPPPPEPPPPPPPPPPEPPPPPPPPPEPEVIKAPDTPPPPRTQVVERKRPPAPVSSYKVPAVIPKNGVAYQIRWGDTLWDISEAFYRNPWLYPRIARHNNIRNPDHIIAGRTIRIPPKN